MQDKLIDEAPSLSTLHMVFIGCGVGILSGISAIFLHYLIDCIHQWVFPHQINQLHLMSGSLHAFYLMGIILLVPILGALCVTFLIEKFAPQARGHGVPEAMYAIYYGQSHIPSSVALVKALASAVCIGTGGSVGREGPIIQIGGALGSLFGQWIRMPSRQRALLVAAGAGAGLAATFNAPLTGLAFAIELMLLSINAISIGIVTIATVTATFIAYLFVGHGPAFDISHLIKIPGNTDYLMILLCLIPFGIFLGIISANLIKSMDWFEAFFTQKFKNPYIRHMIGMSIVGLILLIFLLYFGHFYVDGAGDITTDAVLNFLIQNPWLLLLLFIGKYLATCLTLGSGGSGGIFSPCIFMGATLGALYAIILNNCFPQLAIPPLIFVLAGIAGLVGSGTGAIMTAIVLSFESIGSEIMILPIMATAAIAYLTRLKIHAENLYTHGLSKRGFPLPKSLEAGFITAKKAVDIMEKRIECIPTSTFGQWKTKKEKNIHYLITEVDGNVQDVYHIDTTLPKAINIKTRQVLYWIDSDTDWSSLLRKINTEHEPIILVKHKHTSKEAQHVIGIITYREIVYTAKAQADLS